MKVITVKKILSDYEIAAKEGYFMTEDDFPQVISDDVDIYRIDEKGERKLLLKFRKGVFDNQMCTTAFKALESASKTQRNNRGAAAGLLDISKLPKYVKAIVKRDKFRIYYIGADGKMAKTHLSNYVASNIIGYYDQPDRNLLVKNKKVSKKVSKKVFKKPIPCRLTQFNRKYPKKWDATLPLLKSIDAVFKSLLPDAHNAQLTRAMKTQEYRIDGTAFSTATINYNYRTALHKDKGDYEGGFGNLVVLEKNPGVYAGGWTGFPQYGIAVDVRQGDFLAMDVHEWHGNAEIHPLNSSVKPSDIGRLSLVCYLRKNMIKCANEH